MLLEQLGTYLNMSMCTLWAVNDIQGKDPLGGLQGSEGSFQGIFHLERPLRPL